MYNQNKPQKRNNLQNKTNNRNTDERRAVVRKSPNPASNSGRTSNSTRMTAREMAIASERERRLRMARAKRLRTLFEKIVAVFVFSLIGLAISMTALVVFLVRDFNAYSDKDIKPVVLDVEGEKLIFLKKNEYNVRYGEYYVSLKSVAELPGVSLIGDIKHMTLSLSAQQNSVFTVGTINAKINGTDIALSSPSIFESGDLFVPVSFFECYLSGSVVKFAKPDSSSENSLILTIPESKNFSICSNIPTIMPDKKSFYPASQNAGDYKTDLSAYEQYFNPQNRDEYLRLVSPKNPLESDYVPEDLVEVIHTRPDRARQKMRIYAAKSLEAMLNELYAAGYTDVTVTSAYRSYDYQSTLFNNQVNALRAAYGDQAEAEAAKSINPPGTSEHQSGLCADLHNLSSASQSFASQDAYKWLISHCADFGFILRYPKNTTDITGIIFEPWHYRYVGRYHAQKIMNSGLTLEQYIKDYNNN